MKFLTNTLQSFTRSSKASFLFRSWRKKEMSSTSKQPSDRKDTASPGLDHRHHRTHQQDDKQSSDRKDTATSNLDHPSWVPSVLLPPSAKKQSALLSLPFERKKCLHDYAFVSRKRYLGLSTLVVLLLAFTYVSNIAEAKSEVDTLHQSNYSERTLNHFER